jgi:spermidine synthase
LEDDSIMAYVDRARATSPRGEVVLRERCDGEGGPAVLELRVNGVFVMDTRETTTEEALADAALAAVAHPSAVLVGGLGLGYTVRAVLADHRVEHLAVVEIEEAVVAWMRDGTVPHGPAFLADERITIVIADIRTALQEAAPASYELVLLDVDNGPGFLVHADNEAVYAPGFLRGVDRVLRPGGAVAVWSAAEAPPLHEALTSVFGSARAYPLEVRLQDRDERYWLYLAPGAAPA